MSEKILEINSLGLTYQTPSGETEAIRDLSFDVNRGEFVSLVGPSGCGKTTVLSLIAGLIAPSSGKIAIKSGANVGYMLQRDHLFEWRTILSNVTLGQEIRREKTTESAAYAKSLLEKYGLGEFINRRPNELSGGMRQRVALIRTLALRPEILLLDEPFSALDFQTRLAVCDDVNAIIKAEGKTAILVTHDISEAVSMSDRVIVLTPRPARVRATFTINIAAASPLGRREDGAFSAFFDEIWRTVRGEEEQR